MEESDLGNRVTRRLVKLNLTLDRVPRILIYVSLMCNWSGKRKSKQKLQKKGLKFISNMRPNLGRGGEGPWPVGTMSQL